MRKEKVSLKASTEERPMWKQIYQFKAVSGKTVISF